MHDMIYLVTILNKVIIIAQAGARQRSKSLKLYFQHWIKNALVPKVCDKVTCSQFCLFVIQGPVLGLVISLHWYHRNGIIHQ